MRGAAATAVAIWAARQGADAETIRAEIAGRFGYKLLVTVDQIRPGYIFNETCIDTVPQAITCALEATSYEDAIRNAISIGGDSDTVAAIAGGIAEARFGIPDDLARVAWEKLPLDMRGVLQQLYDRISGRAHLP
jgi:ADP-ribosylglycohydrolase